MKKIRKYAILIAAAIIGAFALEGLQLLSQPKEYEFQPTQEMRAQEASLYPESVLYIAGYEQDQDILRMCSEDPQIMLATEGHGEFSVVTLYFSQQLPANLPIQVYYENEGALSESCSVKTTAIYGSSLCSIQIPAKDYTMIRIDADGIVPLQSISIGNVLPERIAKPAKIHKRRLVIVFIALTIILFGLSCVHARERFFRTIKNSLKRIRTEGKKAIINGLLFPLVIAFSMFAAWALSGGFSGAELKWPMIVFSGIIGLFVSSMVVFRNTLKEQPEYLFLILCLCLGFLLCFFVPHGGENSWDDGHHYTQALNASYVDEIRLTDQDQVSIYHSDPISWDLQNGLEAVHQRQDELYNNGAVSYPSRVATPSLTESFNGLGLFIGRVLGLRYYLIDFSGRFFGLMTYAFLGFFGIRKLKSGKMIAAAVLLIPTSMFIASSFNYDSYVTGFTALGLCYYMALWQNSEAKLTLTDAIIMIASVSIGCISKVVYFPLLWILLLLPKDKFSDTRYKWIYRGAIVAATAAVLLIVFLPSLYGGGGSISSLEDSRGGSEISADGQIRYILTHPFEYIMTLRNYLLKEYWNPSRVHELLTNYAYHGFMPNQYIYLLLLAVVTFTDKNEYDLFYSRRVFIRIISLLLTLAGLVLVLTALYVGFTAVGSNWISGASFRYMMPLALPTLLFIGSGRMENKMNRGTYNGLILSIAAYVNFVCIYTGYISKFT